MLKFNISALLTVLKLAPVPRPSASENAEFICRLQWNWYHLTVYSDPILRDLCTPEKRMLVFV